jgi:uncharacterized protein (TIGR02265 family)
MASEFQSPPWDAPIDVNRELGAIPATATMKGMFLVPMLAEAQRRGIRLPSARDRYLPFSDYPLLEHGRVLVEAARTFFPDISTRRALRKLGHLAHRAFAETTIGKVVWASVDGVDSAIDATAKTYVIATPAARVTVEERAPGRARVRLSGGAHCFIDSNHVGTFEGVLRACQIQGEVTVKLEPGGGEFLLTWTPSVKPPSR